MNAMNISALHFLIKGHMHILMLYAEIQATYSKHSAKLLVTQPAMYNSHAIYLKNIKPDRAFP